MVRAGELDAIRVVQTEYPQDWPGAPPEETGQQQAASRTDPARAEGTCGHARHGYLCEARRKTRRAPYGRGTECG